MSDWSGYMAAAVKAVQNASMLIQIAQQNEVIVLSAEGKDTKLAVDRESEHLIIQSLQSASSFPILTEESGMLGDILQKDQPYWIVDPLDGSLNFQHGIPFYCISVALWVNSEPILGVIYDLPHNKLYTGISSEGAYCNGEPMCVSSTSVSGQAVLATGFPTKRSFDDNALQSFVAQVQNFKKVRLFGAGALSLAYCAEGIVDAYMEEDIMFWDVAAGIALVKAAGGYVSFQPSSRVKWGMTVACGSSSSLFN